jgi:hypothetical protein
VAAARRERRHDVAERRQRPVDVLRLDQPLSRRLGLGDALAAGEVDEVEAAVAAAAGDMAEAVDDDGEDLVAGGSRLAGERGISGPGFLAGRDSD